MSKRNRERTSALSPTAARMVHIQILPCNPNSTAPWETEVPLWEDQNWKFTHLRSQFPIGSETRQPQHALHQKQHHCSFRDRARGAAASSTMSLASIACLDALCEGQWPPPLDPNCQADLGCLEAGFAMGAEANKNQNKKHLWSKVDRS